MRCFVCKKTITSVSVVDSEDTVKNVIGESHSEDSGGDYMMSLEIVIGQTE